MKPLFVVVLLTVIVGTKANAQVMSTTKTIVDNQKLKVTEYLSKPGEDVCGNGTHSHGPHLTIVLTDAEVEITTPEGKKITQKVPAGTSFWSETETHAIINHGKNNVRIQIVELK